ncbi:c-type cytochrome [Beggiatoa leptomitoformis]|uniref:Cytochrome c domain-containing protein n=1 Tax=Beggiatoa leptomitoformis TaxID=288004 RepID=A0A650GRP1_9GAMM|nr:cytochrome c [Beggiatoa leptomitoformis]QGX03786.1 hypothetical protein AL038_19335 [Beggiatoa leptomitoformis]QGX04127.1 hypothetical protein BLE401_18725 [Beggiatoa leptomitoformis]
MKKSVLFFTATLCVGGLLNSSLLIAETPATTGEGAPAPTTDVVPTQNSQPVPPPTTTESAPATSEAKPTETAPVATTASTNPTEKPYEVVCENNACKVDGTTFKGWRVFHSVCYVCHAQDAIGSSFAPSLVERLKDFPKERFVHSVTEGFKGQIGIMPSWKDNPNVMPHLDELWAYLRARSDGVLLPGRPEKLK